MRPDERVAAAQAGRFTVGEMLRWASRRPAEVPVVDGEWFFLSAFLADSCCRERMKVAKIEDNWPR